MGKIYLKEASTKNWFISSENGHEYPGDTNIQLGCLMRIAAATEAMASNYLQLQNELKYWKKLSEDRYNTVLKLQRSNSSLKGHIKRLKNSKVNI